MDKMEFTAGLRQLMMGHDSVGGNYMCTGSKDLISCTSVLFSQDMTGCFRCTHCGGCRDSYDLAHCFDCSICHHCSYCVATDHCTNSAYLVQSSWCSECTYCFGCVGLHKKDFHILNQKYPRDEYFKTTKRLARELGIKLR